MIYGYLRVSTREQNEARQRIALEAFGVERLYADSCPGRTSTGRNTRRCWRY